MARERGRFWRGERSMSGSRMDEMWRTQRVPRYKEREVEGGDRQMRRYRPSASTRRSVFFSSSPSTVLSN